MRQEIQKILWDIEDAIYKIEDEDRLDEDWLLKTEESYYKNRQRFSIKELALIFPEAKSVLEAKKLEILKELKCAHEKVNASVVHYKSDITMEPICKVVIELTFKNEIFPLQNRLARIEYNYNNLVRDKEKREVDIELLKDQIDLRYILERYGVKIKKSGRESICICPFHQDRRPSFSANKRLWHCFGCSRSGDIFDFVMKIENCDFSEAIKKLS